MDRMQQKAIRARGEMLQRRRRIAARGEPVLRERRPGQIVGSDQSVRVCPFIGPAPGARTEGAAESRVDFHQIPHAPALAVALAFEGAVERDQIVLRVIDRVFVVAWGWPIEARLGSLGSALLKGSELRKLSECGAQDLERVEGGHARARLRYVHARVGKYQPSGCGGYGAMQQQPLLPDAVGLRGEAGGSVRRTVHLLSVNVQEQRILHHLSREQTLGQ